MYYGDGNVTSNSKRTIVGNWDSTGGESGGPLQKFYSNTGYTVVGINRGGGPGYSDALRIDKWLYDKLLSYRKLRQ